VDCFFVLTVKYGLSIIFVFSWLDYKFFTKELMTEGCTPTSFAFEFAPFSYPGGVVFLNGPEAYDGIHVHMCIDHRMKEVVFKTLAEFGEMGEAGLIG
jgi:hypothetical protein